MEVRCGGLLFTSNFDSGNLGMAQQVINSAPEQKEDTGSNDLLKPDYEFNIWTKCDCAGQPGENPNRSWFYFGISGATPGKLIKINIMNLNRQGKLYSQGFSPITKTVPGKPKWERIRDKISYETIDNSMVLHFTHRFLDVRGAVTYFAFCYPWSYTECQERLTALDQQFEYCRDDNFISRNAGAIYYHRELLCHSLEQRRVDLITVSDCSGLGQEEPRFDGRLFPDKSTPRCRSFPNKQVYVVTSRVHPGETPASHVFNGFLNFILNESDARARQLRSQFVFKLIPLLNPDGVSRGHYRTDTRGVNLNRVYLNPIFELHPPIYAAKSLLVFHHITNRIRQDETKVTKDSMISNINNNNNNNGLINSAMSTADVTAAMTELDKLFDIPAAFKPLPTNNSAISINDVLATSHTQTNVLASPPPVSSDALPFIYSVFPTATSSLTPRSQSAQSLLLRYQNSVFTSSLLTDTSSRIPVDADKNNLSGSGEFESNLDDLEMAVGCPGNEGSDDDDDEGGISDNGVLYAPHLADPRLKLIRPEHSGLACYVDLHGHASKKGCFIYGNHIEDEASQVENVLFPKLISLNSAHFDFMGCNFTERNMFMKDKRDGQSKEGAGRVAMYTTLGIIHSYTLECNYNTGRQTNTLAPSCGDNGRCSPPPSYGFPPRFIPAHWEEVGKGMAISALDLSQTNPWSRVTLSEYVNIQGVREWVRRYLRSLNQLPRGLPNKSMLAASKAGQSLSAGTVGGSQQSGGGAKHARHVHSTGSLMDLAGNGTKRLSLQHVNVSRQVEPLRKDLMTSADATHSHSPPHPHPASAAAVSNSEPLVFPLRKTSAFERNALKPVSMHQRGALKHSSSLPASLVTVGNRTQSLSLQQAADTVTLPGESDILRTVDEPSQQPAQWIAPRSVYQPIYYPLRREKSKLKDADLSDTLLINRESPWEHQQQTQSRLTNSRSAAGGQVTENQLSHYSLTANANVIGSKSLLLPNTAGFEHWDAAPLMDGMRELSFAKMNNSDATSKVNHLQPNSKGSVMVATGTKFASNSSKIKRSSSYSPMTQRSNGGVQKAGVSKTDSDAEKNKKRVPRRKTSITNKGNFTAGPNLTSDTNNETNENAGAAASLTLSRASVTKDDVKFKVVASKLVTAAGGPSQPMLAEVSGELPAGNQRTPRTTTLDLSLQLSLDDGPGVAARPAATKKGRKKKPRLQKKKALLAARAKALQAMAETASAREDGETLGERTASFWVDY